LRAKLQLARDDRDCVICQGSLPCHPIMAEQVDRFWRLVTEFPDVRIKAKGVSLGSPRRSHSQRCRSAADRLANMLNQWLHVLEFREIERALLKFAQPNDRLWLSISTDDQHIRLLPWQAWAALSDYEFEWGCTPIDGWRMERPSHTGPPGLVQVLAVLGDRDCLDLSPDRDALQRLHQDGKAAVTLLDAPSAEVFFQQLSQTPPDLLVFSGHGRPGEGDRSGQITIAPGRSLSVEDFSHALEKAVRHGLQVGIFNCCYSIDLAQALHRLHLPVAIVMRAPVPDVLAQQFINDFLRLYAQGNPLAIAFREARRGLQALEPRFPGATWLPLIYHHPFVQLPAWDELRPAIATPAVSDEPTDRRSELPVEAIEAADTPPPTPTESAQTPAQPGESPPLVMPRPGWHRAVRWLGRSLGVAAIATVITTGLSAQIEPIELAVYDFWLQQRPPEAIDDRLLLVTIDQADIDYQDRQGWQRLIWRNSAGSLTPEALTRLLDRLAALQPSAIGLDIYYPAPSHSPAQWQRWAKQGLFGICKVADSTSDTAEIPAPPYLPGNQLTFADVHADRDGVVRRHLLSMPFEVAQRSCQTNYALSAALADHYLQQRGQTPNHQRTTGQWGYDDRSIPQLVSGAGGYGPLAAAENQLLLNFRQGARPWRSISLTQVLQGGIPPQWQPHPHPIVLIGSIHRNSNDWWTIPGGRTIPGLELQAHGVSQLVSAMLDDRPLLQALAWPAKGVWIVGWVGVVVLGWSCLPQRSPWRDRFFVVIGAIGLMTGASALSFGIWSWWLPTATPAIAMLIALPFSDLAKSRENESKISRKLT
jgi:CHASE2 domain-containing sensor protein